MGATCSRTSPSCENMGTFTGTTSEFRRYIGPRLRNIVNLITRQHKAEVAKCEQCGCSEKGKLEAAHVAGRDRNQLIDLILQPFIKDGIVTVDVAIFEKLFETQHHPIHKSILILCRACHKKYDARGTLASSKTAETRTHYSVPKLKLVGGVPGASTVKLVRLLQSVGKRTFVRHYREFGDLSLTNQKVSEMLPSEFTEKSRISRTAHARRIFRDGLQHEALEFICNSARVDPETRKNARKFLRLQQRPSS